MNFTGETLTKHLEKRFKGVKCFKTKLLCICFLGFLFFDF